MIQNRFAEPKRPGLFGFRWPIGPIASIAPGLGTKHKDADVQVVAIRVFSFCRNDFIERIEIMTWSFFQSRVC
jgi:hypothetical protein